MILESTDHRAFAVVAIKLGSSKYATLSFAL